MGRSWRDDLVNLYGRIKSPAPDHQLATAEAWLEDRPDDGELLLAAGRLALMNADWPKELLTQASGAPNGLPDLPLPQRSG